MVIIVSIAMGQAVQTLKKAIHLLAIPSRIIITMAHISIIRIHSPLVTTMLKTAAYLHQHMDSDLITVII